MNSQNQPGKDPTRRPNLPQGIPRYGYPNPHGSAMDQYMMMNNFMLQPQLQMMLKWRNQMTQLARSQEALGNPYPFMDPSGLPPMSMGEMHPMMLNSPEMSRRDFQNFQYKGPPMPDSLYNFPPYPMMHPMQPQNRPNESRMRMGQHQGPPRHSIQKNKNRVGENGPKKDPTVIVIDQQQDVIPVPIPPKKQVIDIIEDIPEPLPRSILSKPAQIYMKKLVPVPEVLPQKKQRKSIIRKDSDDERLEQDSFKPSGMRTKKIQKQKKKAKIQRQKQRAVRHRETERQKAIKEKKLTQDERVYQSKPPDQQGKIMVSTYHQAVIPEFKFGNIQYQKQKQKKKQSLISRLEFQGSAMRDQYKKLKEAVPNWPSSSLLNILKQKFGSLLLSNKAQLLPDVTENEKQLMLMIKNQQGIQQEKPIKGRMSLLKSGIPFKM